LYIKKTYPAPERSLRQIKVSTELGSQDYNLDDDMMEITRKQFMDKLNLKDHVNLHKPLENYLSNSRVLTGEDDEPLPDIKEDFFKKVKEGIDEAFDAGTYTFKDGDNMITISKGDENICDVKLRTEAQKDKEHHNVFITMDNYAYTGDFDRKKMEGLSIIETEKNHRDEISSFMTIKLPEFEATEDENEAKSENGLKSVGEGLGELLTKVDADVKLIGGDENSGYVYEKRAEGGMILVLAIAYKIGPELYEVRIKTRAMDEFEMQVREFLREEDKGVLETQITQILDAPGVGEGFTIQDIASKLDSLIGSVPARLTPKCPDGMSFSLEGLGEVPNTAILNTDSLGGGDMSDMGFDFGGGGEGEEEKPAKDELKCVFQTAYVILLQGLDMPYIFFSFQNMRLMVEHFVPAIDKASTEKALEDAWQGIMDLSNSIEDAIDANYDQDGNPIANMAEFNVEKLKSEIDKATKSIGLKRKEEAPNTYWEEGNIIRVMMTDIDTGFKVNFNFPHKLFKNKESSKPITNEFIFKKAIAYDAVNVFMETLNKFVAAVKEANGKGKKI
jgi:hypothetical protein